MRPLPGRRHCPSMLLPSSSLPLALLACLALPAASAAADFAKDIKPLLASHCVECHGDQKVKGGVDLGMVADEAAVRRDLATWRKVAEQLASREMPTDKAKRPLADADRATLAAWLDGTLKSALAEA